MFRVNIPLEYSFDVGVDGFELKEIDVAPELMEKWELHWYPQNISAEERRIRVIHKQFEEFFTMQKRIFAEVPSMLHEVKVLHEIVASKKECKADDAAHQLVVDERKEQERQTRLGEAQTKLEKRQNCMRWRGVGAAPASVAAPAPAPAPPTAVPTATTTTTTTSTTTTTQAPAPATAPFAQEVFQQRAFQQEMRQFFQQLAGLQPFAPVQPTPPIHVAPAAAAAPVFVKQEAPATFPSPNRKRKSSEEEDSEDEGDVSDLGEPGGAADMRDKAIDEANERRAEARQQRKKSMKRVKRARNPNTFRFTKKGKPDRRRPIVLESDSDYLDEKHDAPMPPTQPAPMPPAEPAVNIPLPSVQPSPPTMEQQPAAAVVPDPVPPTPSVEPANSACPSLEPASVVVPPTPAPPAQAPKKKSLIKSFLSWNR